MTYLSEINCCVFVKLQRQLCDGNADTNADDWGDNKYLFLYLQFSIDELMGHIMRKSIFVIFEQQRRRSVSASTQND